MFKMNIKASQYDKNVHVSLYHTRSKFGKNKTNSKLDHPSKSVVNIGSIITKWRLSKGACSKNLNLFKNLNLLQKKKKKKGSDSASKPVECKDV